jgi:hypothetical protein
MRPKVLFPFLCGLLFAILCAAAPVPAKELPESYSRFPLPVHVHEFTSSPQTLRKRGGWWSTPTRDPVGNTNKDNSADCPGVWDRVKGAFSSIWGHPRSDAAEPVGDTSVSDVSLSPQTFYSTSSIAETVESTSLILFLPIFLDVYLIYYRRTGPRSNHPIEQTNGRIRKMELQTTGAPLVVQGIKA